ncbi:hypothetical protein BH20ACI1_BH20ACI1_04340 [soil metagenome]
MNMPNKFITNLSDEDHTKLLENYRTSAKFRVCNRARAILLSSESYSIDEIAAICGVHRTAVSRWLDRFNEFGVDALADLPRDGRPPILTDEEQAQAVRIGLRNPKFPHRQIGKNRNVMGKDKI